MAPDNKIRLKHEIDYSKSIQGAKDLESRLGGTHDRLKKSFGGLASDVKGIGDSLVDAAPKIQGATSDLVELGGSLAGSFAVGGVAGLFAGSVSVIGTALGFLGAQSKQVQQPLSRVAKEVNALQQENAKLAREIRAGRGIDVLAEDAENAERSSINVRIALRRVRDEISQIRRADKDDTDEFGIFSPENRGDAAARSVRLSELEERQKSLARAALDNRQKAASIREKIENRDQKIAQSQEKTAKKINALLKDRLAVLRQTTEAGAREAEQAQKRRDVLNLPGVDADLITRIDGAERAKRQREIAKTLSDQGDSIVRANALLREQHPLERQLLKIEQDRAEALRSVATLSGDSEEVSRTKARLASEINANARLQADAATLAFKGPLDTALGRVGPTFATALTQGAVQGWRNFSDLGKNAIKAIGSSLFNVFAQFGLFNLLGGQGGLGGVLFPSLVSLDSGGITRRDTTAQLHKNEVVAPLDRLRSMIREESGGGGDVLLMADTQALSQLGFRSPNAPIFRSITSTRRSRTLQDKRRRGF